VEKNLCREVSVRVRLMVEFECHEYHISYSTWISSNNESNQQSVPLWRYWLWRFWIWRTLGMELLSSLVGRAKLWSLKEMGCEGCGRGCWLHLQASSSQPSPLPLKWFTGNSGLCFTSDKRAEINKLSRERQTFIQYFWRLSRWKIGVKRYY